MPLPAAALTAFNVNTGVALVGNVLQNPGDCIQANLGQSGVGQPTDPTAILSLCPAGAGGFTGAVVAIEGVPLGQPLTQVVAGQPVAPSQNQWVDTLDVLTLTGAAQTSPVGPLTAAPGAGNGFGFAVGCGLYSMLRLRLVSISSGQVQGGLATVPFPVGSVGPGGAGSGSVNSQNTVELGRIRVGLSILLEGLGINLQDLTAQDIQSLS